MRSLPLALVFLAACHDTVPSAPVATDTGTKAAPTSTTALPGPAIRDSLDHLGDCAAKVGAFTGGRAWQRTGGLLNRTLVRGRGGGDLSVAMIFPKGPDGPIDATGGYGRFMSRDGAVDVELLVTTSAAGAVESTRLTITLGGVKLAELPVLAASVASVPTAAWLGTELDKTVDQKHTLSPAQLATRQVCVVLPPARPGVPGRGQDCHSEPTTAADRAQMLENEKAAAKSDHDAVKTNLPTIAALVGELYPFTDTTCATKLAPGASP